MGRIALTNLRHALFGLLAAGAAVVFLRFALRGLDWPSFMSQLRNIDWRWLLVAVVFDIASYAAQGLRWRYLLEGSNVWQTTRAIYAGLFLNELVPMRPGEAVRAWLASRDLKVRLLHVAPTILTERLMEGFWLAAALLGALSLAPLPHNLVEVARWAVALILAALLGAWLLGRTRFAPLRRVNEGLGNWRALLASSGFLVGQGLAFWAVIRASHLPLGLLGAFVVMVVVRIGTLIPGANLGTHQFSTVLGLSLYGVNPSDAAGFSLVVFTVLTAPLLAIGFGACLSAGIDWRGILQALRNGGVFSPLHAAS